MGAPLWGMDGCTRCASGRGVGYQLHSMYSKVAFAVTL
jgi:hypothetical protein